MLKNQLLNPPAKAGVFSTSNRMKKPQMKLLDKTLKIDQNTAQGTESSVHPKRDSKLQRRCTTPTTSKTQKGLYSVKHFNQSYKTQQNLQWNNIIRLNLLAQ
jgi:hypothetical protein